MKFLLIPINNHNFSDDVSAFMPAIILNLITAIIFTIWGFSPFLSKHVPTLHGWIKFGICVIFIIALTILSFMPYIGYVLSLLSAIFWIMCILSLTKGISTSWLKWTLRVLCSLLVILFEGSVFLMWK